MIKKENTPTIETQRLRLRKFDENDAESLLAIFSDEVVNQYLPWFPLTTIQEAKTFLTDRFLSYYEMDSAYRYAVCLKEDDKPIGYVWLSETESHDFGYGLLKDYWNQGIMTEACIAIIDRIKDAGYQYITATHDINNPASGEVMKKLGMSYRYTYVEQWQPKDIEVSFRMYQLNFDGDTSESYMGYWNRYSNHFIESL